MLGDRRFLERVPMPRRADVGRWGLRLRDTFDAAATFADQKIAYARGRPPKTMPLLYFEVIKACNLRCSMCAYPTDYPTRGKLLSTDELVRIIDDSRQLGTKIVSFGGGEPFLRKDINDLIDATERMGLALHINTNGTKLGDPIIYRLSEARRLTLVFSIDHPDAGPNDAIRGEGVWDQVKDAVRRVRMFAPKVHIGLNCVVTKEVLGRLDDMVDLSAQWGVQAIKFLPLHSNLGHRWGDGTGVRNLDYDSALYDRIGDELLAAAERARALGLATSSKAFLSGIPKYLRGTLEFPCYAGYVYGNIDPYGMLFPCYDHMELLDVREIGIVAAWKSEAMQRMRAKVRGCEHQCWNSGNAEPSIRMSTKELFDDPGQVLADLALFGV